MRLIVAAGVLAALVQSQVPGLRIVVLEGEDAVNIVQQKTAVRALVEVRDRNNVPVAGATVTFTIGGGQPAAFAGRAPAFTVTTNTAGQAATQGIDALRTGAVKIQVQAAYQGQVATATISQTIVATAAMAAVTGGAAAGAGAGGGLSGSTIGIIGAAVGGGALVATQVAGGSGDNSIVTAPITTPIVATTPTPATPPSADVTFTGPIAGQIVVTTTSGDSTCVSTRSINGTMTITLRDANTRGSLRTTGTVQEISLTASRLCSLWSGCPFNPGGDITGGPSNLAFATESSFTSTEIASVTSTESVRFNGSVSGNTITGTLAYTHTTRGTGSGGSSIAGNGTTSIPVTLR